MSISQLYIKPGPELRVKIDRVAEKVAEKPAMGPKLLAARREEFGFLVEGHEFHPYYLSKLHDFKANAPTAAAAAAGTAAQPQNATTAAAASSATTAGEPPAKPKSALEKALADLKEKGSLTRDPHPELYSIPMTASNAVLPPLELDIMKRAAAYRAKAGDAFWELLLARHSTSQGFEFLREDHPRHRCFQALYSAYRRVLQGPDEAVLQRDCGPNCIDAIRLECEEKKAFTAAEQARQRAAQLSEPELRQRLVWTEFSVVGRFTLADLGITPTAAATAATAAPGAEGHGVYRGPAASSSPANGATVVEDYSAQGRANVAAPVTMRDSASGLVVAADSATEHLKALLVASKAAEDRERQERRLREDTNLADDAELEANLAARFGKQARSEASYEVNK